MDLNIGYSSTQVALAQARVWDISARLEKEWDGADEGLKEDLAALRVAADILEAVGQELQKPL